MDGNPATVWFLWMVTERTERKKKRKGKATQPQRRQRYIHGNGAAKNLKTSLKTLFQEGIAYYGHVWKDCFFFLKLQWRGDISRNCCYLYIHSLLFQSMINKWKSLVKGGVDLVLLSLSTSPHPTPPFYALPRLPDSSPPPTSACFGQSLRAVTWWGIKPACRYCSSFHFFNNVSCRWCPHVLPLCISRKMDFCFGFVTFHFPLLHFGLSSEVRARTLVYERKPPPIVLIVWFVVSILMRWNPSCRIFCIARIVRQWEDGGAIWREFSYWWNLSNCP